MSPRGRVWQAHRRGDVDYILAALTDTDAGVRDIAARSLGLLRDPRAVKPLLLRLRSGDDGHRILVMKALGRIGDQAALPELHEIAADTREFGQVRILAMSAIGAIGDRAAIPMIAEVLIDPESPYSHAISASSRRAAKRWSARRLLQLGGHESIPRLQEALSASPWRDRPRLWIVIKRLQLTERTRTLKRSE